VAGGNGREQGGIPRWRRQLLRRRQRQEARGDGSGPIVVAIVVIVAIVIAAAGGEVADEEDVQRCDVQCLTLFFQCCALGKAGGKNELKNYTTSNLDMQCSMFDF
jgi:hypothetical protein